jgi:hypothetical protein
MEIQSILLWLTVPLLTYGAAFVFIFLMLRKRRLQRAQNKLPFDELRRRPAGEALRLKLMGLDDKLTEETTTLLIVPGLICLCTWFSRAKGLPVFIPLILLSLAWTFFIAKRLVRTFQDRSNYQLGFDGERFVGEELTRLIGAGFEVYHDVPFDGFNMDHVLVGPPGVFLVETKTRRKPVIDSRTTKCQVEFDGEKLYWPRTTETRDLEQATNNARTLSRWLASAAGDPVYVTPILTFPGWWVALKKPCKTVFVLNPKQIYDFCAHKPPVLDSNMIKRICHQMNEKCKLEIE